MYLRFRISLGGILEMWAELSLKHQQ